MRPECRETKTVDHYTRILMAQKVPGKRRIQSGASLKEATERELKPHLTELPHQC
jgi:hypothetical protein